MTSDLFSKFGWVTYMAIFDCEWHSLTENVSHTSQSRARIRKLPTHDHMTHVIKIDIITGHEEMGKLHFILKFIFNCIFIEKNMHFLKTCTIKKV